MKVKKKLKRLIAMLACVVLVLGSTMVTQAANNPYPLDGGHGVEGGNCTWRAWQEAYDRLGVALPAWSHARYWYDSAQAAGYTVVPWIPGNYVPSNSIAVWDGTVGGGFGHVAFVASADENGFTLIEGNFQPNPPDGPYYSRWEQYWSYGARSSGLIGFIVLDGQQTPSVSLTWSGDRCEPDASNVFIYTEAHTNVSGSFTEAGVTVWDEAGNVVASKSENPAQTGTQLNIWYNITDETGVVLQSGTNYTYQIYTVFNGTRYTTDVKSFRTFDTEPTGPAENTWTQELAITDWTYGETPNMPSAAAAYGTVSYTYSTEPDGTYTTEVPDSAGTYYVKATVSGTDMYTGLEVVKEFHINKAVPEYIVPDPLTATYGDLLHSVSLPVWFSWKDTQQSVGDVGEKTFLASYNMYDPNYEVVNNIEIPVNVVPADITDGLDLSGIDENTDLDAFKITFGTETLVQGKDYEFRTETNGSEVTVTIEFMGNFTGTAQTSYTLIANEGNIENGNAGGNGSGSGNATNNTDNPGKGDTDKKTDNGIQKNDKTNNSTDKVKSPKTGDETIFVMWSIIVIISFTTVIAVLKNRKAYR